MSQNKKKYLEKSLERLEVLFEKIQKTQIFSKDEKRIRILQEMLKEQIENENSHPTTR